MCDNCYTAILNTQASASAGALYIKRKYPTCFFYVWMWVTIHFIHNKTKPGVLSVWGWVDEFWPKVNYPFKRKKKGLLKSTVHLSMVSHPVIWLTRWRECNLGCWCGWVLCVYVSPGNKQIQRQTWRIDCALGTVAHTFWHTYSL